MQKHRKTPTRATIRNIRIMDCSTYELRMINDDFDFRETFHWRCSGCKENVTRSELFYDLIPIAECEMPLK